MTTEGVIAIMITFFGMCSIFGLWISCLKSEIRYLRKNHVTVIYDTNNGTVRIEEGERYANRKHADM